MKRISGISWIIGLHMGPNHTSLFGFSLCPHVTFYKTLMSLSTVFIKGHVGFLQLLKWPCHSFFTHDWSPWKLDMNGPQIEDSERCIFPNYWIHIHVYQTLQRDTWKQRNTCTIYVHDVYIYSTITLTYIDRAALLHWLASLWLAGHCVGGVGCPGATSAAALRNVSINGGYTGCCLGFSICRTEN